MNKITPPMVHKTIPPLPYIKIPNLKGRWEGKGNFLLINPYGGTTKKVEADVVLSIFEQDGNKFIGNLAARYLDPNTGNDPLVYIGDGLVGGHIQRDSTAPEGAPPKWAVNMFGGVGEVPPERNARFVVEVDGQYEANVSPAQGVLTCRWRSVQFNWEVSMQSSAGAPAAGEFTLTPQAI